MTMIPELFAKALHSSLSATRFGELLKDAAGASFIKPRDLGALCVEGISTMIDKVLQERLLAPSEEDRIEEIKQALGPALTDMSALNEKLIKISVLRELKAGEIPDRVTVVGPLPNVLRKHERVVWIFNQVVSYKRSAPEPAAGITFPATEQDLYCGLRQAGDDPMPTENLTKEAVGDLVVTSRNIYFVHDKGTQRIPMAKITALQPYADAVQVTCEQSQDRSRAFKLKDAWMLANLIIGLMLLAQRKDHAEPA